MTMNLQDYFDLRCMDTLDALSNMQVLFDDLRNHISDAQLKDIVQQQYDAIRSDAQALSQITNRPVPEQPQMHTTESQGESGERLIVVGRTWIGEAGRGMVEHYRVYVTRVPQQLIDVNAAMLCEEVCHFNLGNYTGLIVLAKELGKQDVADQLQGCIDRQSQIRTLIENSLWQIIGNQHQQEMSKAA